ncbi:Golgi reassembly-stacking protein 2 [Mortierella alpina]|nr:Golgi reassembly-stacking protein 2 [Mortierella alpina]
MGNSASGDEGRYRLGYHVLRVKADSPAHQAGLRPYFDYIMAVNDIRLNTESTVLRDQMEASVDKPIVLDVYSTREQALRRIEMVPRRNWSGADEDGLLGCSIRFALFDTIIDIVWHVLDITPGSPAEQAGLCAHSDYVIGTPLGIMRGEGDLYDLIEDYIGDPLPLHVYNVDRNQVREVVIVPSEEWGGEGLLGCDVGYGYLHRLPRQPSLPSEEQKDSLKEDTPHNMGQHLASQESVDPGLDGKDDDANGSKITVSESPDEHVRETLLKNHHHVDSAASADASEKIRSQHSDTLPSGTLESTTPRENSQQPGHEPPSANGNSNAPMTAQETHSSASAETQPTLYPQASSPPIYPKAATPLHENASGRDQASMEGTSEGVANGLSSSAPLASQEPSQEAEEPLTEESEEHQQRQPPSALASRMLPGIHGRGGRRGHDGYSARDRIPLQAAQAQAEEQSAEYRAQMERDLKDGRDRKTEGEAVMQEQRSPVHENLGVVKDKGEEKVVEDNTNSMMEQQEVDHAVHEFVVEGMIRNMALGSTVFPL